MSMIQCWWQGSGKCKVNIAGCRLINKVSRGDNLSTFTFGKRRVNWGRKKGKPGWLSAQDGAIDPVSWSPSSVMKEVNEAENVWEKISEKVKMETVIRIKVAYLKIRKIRFLIFKGYFYLWKHTKKHYYKKGNFLNHFSWQLHYILLWLLVPLCQHQIK